MPCGHGKYTGYRTVPLLRMTNSVEYVGTNSSPNLKSHRAFVLYIRRTPELWIFLAVLVVRILILNRFAASPYFLPASDDMKFYADWAMRISDGHWTDGAAFYGCLLYTSDAADERSSVD